MEIHLSGPAGRLEGILEEPETRDDRGPRGAALLCHPHPLHGGSMRNSIVFRAARALRSVGFATLRLNFRGVEGSEGVHDGEGAEEGDAAAGLDHLQARYPRLPLWAVGYSFGARTLTLLAGRDPRIERLVLIAFPVRVYDPSPIASLTQPTLLLFGGADEFGTAASLRQRLVERPPNLTIEEIPAADHLFRGRTPEVEERVRSFAAD
jgi:uncharacterized protein